MVCGTEEIDQIVKFQKVIITLFMRNKKKEVKKKLFTLNWEKKDLELIRKITIFFIENRVW